MRLNRLSIAFAVTGLLALGCSNPADNKPVAEVGAIQPEATAATAKAPASPAPENTTALAIDAGTSTIGFIGSKVTGSHEGGFKSFRGSVVLDADAKTIYQVTAEIDMDSTWSDNDKLTDHLKNQDFFDVPKHPKSRFASTSIEPGANLSGGATHTVRGDLTLHGITREIAFPAKLTVNGTEAATLDSEFSIKRRDFGVSYDGKTDDLIRDEVVLKLSIKAKQSGAAG